MAVSRPSTAIFAGTTPSSAWIAKDTQKTLTEIRQAHERGNYEIVEHLCTGAASMAVERGDLRSAAKLLDCTGGAHFARFQYREALKSYFEARKLAQSAGDREELGAILLNLSSLYLQVWDTASARRSVEESLAVTQKLPGIYYKPELLLQMGRLQGTSQAGAAAMYFRQGIEAASKQGNASTESQGMDLLGELLKSSGNFEGAEAAYLAAYRLRLKNIPSRVGFSLARLGNLKLARAVSAPHKEPKELAEAERLTRDALRLQADSRKPSLPEFILRHQLGLIHNQQGNSGLALADLRTAIYETQATRQHFPAAVSSFEGANAGLEETIFVSFVETAGKKALDTGSSFWARESFLAAEINRAASLRQDIAMADVWRKKLPPDYWETLAALRQEDAKMLTSAKPRTALSQRFELRLSEMEARAGLDFSQEKFENFDDFRSLKHILEGLRESEVLLSFHLGERQSFLWAVTRNSFRLYPLGSRDQIRQSIKEFRDAVQSGGPEAFRLGQQLYRELFGQLGAERSKAAWLLSLEDALFELPFGALVPGSTDANGRQGSNRPMYLIESHSLQIVPGAFLLKQQRGSGTVRGRMVAVGDPIYNTADPRWHASSTGLGMLGLAARQRIGEWIGSTNTEGLSQLNRLVGSAAEAEVVSRAWGSAPTTILEGKDASRDRLLQAMEPAPDVIHLATHVLADRLSGRKPFIALGLGADLQPELLSATDIGVLRVPDSLVVMTGCSTATGDILAGAGLQGLTEAWALAKPPEGWSRHNGPSAISRATFWPASTARSSRSPPPKLYAKRKWR